MITKIVLITLLGIGFGYSLTNQNDSDRMFEEFDRRIRIVDKLSDERRNAPDQRVDEIHKEIEIHKQAYQKIAFEN